MSTTTATPTERRALVELHRILRDARGDHPALAEVRRATCEAIDQAVGRLAAFGVQTDALLDEIEVELDSEEVAARA